MKKNLIEFIQKIVKKEDIILSKQYKNSRISSLVKKKVYNIPDKFSLGNVFYSLNYKELYVLVGLYDGRNDLKRMAMVNLMTGREFFSLNTDNERFKKIITKEINKDMIYFCMGQTSSCYLTKNYLEFINKFKRQHK